MTVPSQTSRDAQAGNGVTLPFTVPFRILEATHLRVLLTVAGVTTEQTLTTHYSVSGVGDASTTVTFVTAPPSGSTVTFLRNVPFTQETDYVPNDPFPAESHERALDKLTMLAQQLNEIGGENGRTIKIPAQVSGILTTLPVPVAGKLWGWDAAGTAPRYYSVSELATTLAFSNFKADPFTATAGQTDFILTADPGALANLDVSIDGVTQVPVTDYTYDGTTLTFTSAMVGGEKVLARYGTALPTGITDSDAILFMQSGTGAVERTMQDKAREIVSALDFGADPTNATVSTTAFNNAIAAAAGGVLLIPNGEYTTDRIIPEANTTIVIEPGTVIHGISGGSRVFQIQNENVHVWGYGAQTVMDGSQSSHNVYILYPAENCSVRGLHAVGSGGTGDDCFYIGGNPALGQRATNIQLIDCIGEGLGANTRNGLSVAACDGYLVEGCEFFNCTGSPGAGIDLEANVYMADGTSALRRGILRRNKVHDNDTGIVGVFFDDCIVEDNEVYDNVSDGIGTAAGGEQFTAGVYRAGDVLGVSAFDLGTGFITVLSSGKLTDDYGIRPGTIVAKRSRNGGTWPAELALTLFVVTEVSTDQLSFKLGTADDYGEITSFAGGGTGTTSTDPEVADRYFHVYREGNNSNLTLRRNKLWGNGSSNGQIKLAQGVNLIVEDNDLLSDNAGIGITYSQGVSVFRNGVRFDGTDATGYRGINVGVCSGVKTGDNRVHGFGAEGLQVDGSRASCVNDSIQNCGYVGTRSARFQNGHSMLISPIIWNDEQHVPVSQGLVVDSTVTNSIIENARCKGAGTTNATSIVVSSNTNKVVNSIVYDGTHWGEGSTTYDPGSLADGAGVTTNVTCTGAVAGDFAVAAFSQSLSGITMTCYATGNNVAVRFQNETGGVLDLASGTLKVKVIR